MRLAFITILILSISTVVQAQTQPALRADTHIDKSKMLDERYPKITVNDTKCRFDYVAVRPGQDSQYELEINFARDCDGHSSLNLSFNDLQEAILVKNLMLTENDYEFFNLKTSESKTPDFEIIYKSKH